jgi:hypothetical protein
MLPESALPDAAFAALVASGAEALLFRQSLGEAGLIRRHRVEKSASLGGSVQTAWTIFVIFFD